MPQALAHAAPCVPQSADQPEPCQAPAAATGKPTQPPPLDMDGAHGLSSAGCRARAATKKTQQKNEQVPRCPAQAFATRMCEGTRC
mmetsp:Transcript_93864/g.261314  ORF Transcript_93864/g.261314 Transcript_93864/m.261314 type:complete len:86 (+) Transcript_93864:277-534(+)